MGLDEMGLNRQELIRGQNSPSRKGPKGNFPSEVHKICWLLVFWLSAGSLELTKVLDTVEGACLWEWSHSMAELTPYSSVNR